jgi:hypothetical protein
MAPASDDRHLGDEDADVDEEAPPHRPAARWGLSERIRGGARRGDAEPADVGPGRATVSTKRAIDRLDERERRFSFGAAGGAALFGVIVYLSETNSHKALAKGQVSPQTSLAIGLVSAALLFIATFIGRRAPVGFVALFTFLAFSSNFVLGLPFLALAAWLLHRSWKTQRAAAAKVRSARAESGSSTSRAAVASARTSRNSPSKASRTKGPIKPEGNKRYTPKRPPPAAPKPSRRERKAAGASD